VAGEKKPFLGGFAGTIHRQRIVGENLRNVNEPLARTSDSIARFERGERHELLSADLQHPIVRGCRHLDDARLGRRGLRARPVPHVDRVSCAHNKTSYTYGMFRQAQGRFVIDKTNPANCKFQLTIDANSIDTNQPQRDTHLKSDTFFNVAQFPTITFDSTSVTQAGSTQGVVYQVTGNLTMHGVTKPIVLQVQLVGQGPDPSGGNTMRAS